MTAALAHRGPDQTGVWESPHVSLGATRLKILDLAGGDQPMVSPDGDRVIVFNGEIYNHAELRNELAQKGHKFVSRTDTETVLAAFTEWDTDCFRRLRGMFAVALWSERSRRLVMARDRVGIKPLYFSRRGREILFGSEIKALFAHPEVDRTLDRRSLDCYLALNYVPGPRTLVQDIEKLSPGCWLEWVNGETRIDRFWTLPYKPALSSNNDAPEQLEFLLDSAVREHLLSDVPVGVWLSGGLDSSTILHYAARASSAPLRTFSISFRGRSFDESRIIARTVSDYGTRHEQYDLQGHAGLQQAIEDFAYFSDDPNADAGALPVWFLSKLSRRDVTVALSGEGADELFAGYLTYRADELAAFARRLPRPFIGLGSYLAERLPVSDEKIGFEYKLKRFLRGVQMPPEQAHTYWNGTFETKDRRALLQEPDLGEFAELLASFRRRGCGLKGALWFDQRYYLPEDILSKSDRMSMAHSLEVRPPFLDHRLVEFAAALPEQLLMRGGRQKLILRDLMKSRLSSVIVSRKKIGFDIPVHDWLRGPLRTFLTETLRTGLDEYPDLLARSQVERCLHRHLARIENLGYHLWGLMILFLWMRKWRIQDHSSSLLSHDLSAAASLST